MRPPKLLLFVTALLLAPALPSHGQSGDPKTDLEKKIGEQFVLTRFTKDGSDIVSPGAVLVLQKDGLLMYSTAAPLPPANTYKNGKIRQGWGGFGRDMAIGLLSGSGHAPSETYPQRTFVTGEKFWVGAIQVQKDAVDFQVYSDPYDGVRYYSQLKIPFPKGSPSPDAVLQAVSEILTVQPADSSPAGPAPPQQTALAGQYFLKETGAHMVVLPDGSFVLTSVDGQERPGHYSLNGSELTVTYSDTGRFSHFKIQDGKLYAPTGVAWVRTDDVPGSTPSPAAPEQAMAPIPPPPPPADAPATPPKTISLGQTKDQVVSVFGQPEKIVQLGPKEIVYYPGMKVTFVAGKVADVE